MLYPDILEIVPLSKAPRVAVAVPGSKSITNRALVLAALGHPIGCELDGALLSEDTDMMMSALRLLGFYAAPRSDVPTTLKVFSRDSHRLIPADAADLHVGNSGTTMRFLTAMLSLGTGRYRLDGVPRMRERPIDDLLVALRELGVDARSESGNGCPPVLLQANGWRRQHVKIKASVSSQFLSGLLMTAPFAENDTTIEVTGDLVSEPYVRMTVAMLRQWGKIVEERQGASYFVPGRQFAGREADFDYSIEPDASSASYFFAAAAIADGRVTVLDFPENSLQGDVGFVDVLAAMGCRVERCSAGITVHGAPLRGIDIDMNAISDTVMTLAAVACFADGPTTIRNVGHIRHKETDRLAALAAELRKVGADVDEFADGLRITPRPLHGAAIDTYDDHRMAMSMALIGLKVPGVIVKNPGCVAKTYPHFFDDLERLR